MNKILKGFNVLLLSALTGTVAHGKGVNESMAKIVGCNQLIASGAKGVTTPDNLTTAYVATTQGVLGVTVDYYVFNIQDGIGFVMVSADDIIIPILAYSTESSFDYASMAPAARDWVDGYKNEIAASIAVNYPAQEGTAEKWAALMSGVAKHSAAKKTTVPKLVMSTWDQEPGYNNYTPVPGGGASATPTGCVATAIAQVMKYWKWPTVGVGYHSYVPPTYAPTARFADFGNTVYNWTAMPNTSSNTYVATLMSHVGIAVDMNYAPGESGAYTLIAESPVVNCSEYALKTYFHYKSTIHGVQRYDPTGAGGWVSNVTAPAWGAILKVDIDAGKPILYSGQGVSGGHAWVCDGYDVSNFFHFNWGWGGNGPDGFYSVDNLNPPALGVGGGGGNFNNHQGVIMGIEPDSFNAVSGNIKMLAHIDHTINMPVQYPVSSITVNTKILNSNTAAYSGDFALQVFDNSLHYLLTLPPVTGKSIAVNDSLPLSFSSSTPLYQLVPGNYKLRVLYRPTGGSTWTLVADNGTFINENGLAIGNDQSVELATVITTPGSTSSIKVGSSLTVNAKIKANATFNGTVRAVLTNVTTGTQTPVGATVSESLLGGSPSSLYAFTTSSVSVTPGTYTLAIQHKAASASSFTYTGCGDYYNPIIVSVGYGLAGVNTPSFAEQNIHVFPNPANDVVNVDMAGINVSRITITDVQGRQVQELAPDATQTAVTVPVNNYAAGIYFINLYTDSEVVTKKIVVAK
ncbi:MAG: Peptidase family protein [Flavipsychrobacter sp.]|nr:Peptidase family protein [Flavipsychrobacter sp.]